MKQRRKFILFTGIVVILPFLIASYKDNRPIAAPNVPEPAIIPTSPTNPYWEDLLVDYEESMQQLLHKTGIPGASITIVKDTSIMLMTGLGVKTVHSTDSVDKNSVFRVGSVSKCFASVLTAILVKEGYLNWDDPVIKYLPDFKLKSPEQTACLTIRHVLSHTTGLPYHTYTNLIEDGMDIETMLTKLGEIDCGTVGEVYSYQNVAYSIIGEVLRKATGRTYEELLQQKIFTPLKMKNSSVSYEAITSNKNVAHPHLLRHHRWKEIPISDKYYNAAPAGGVNSCGADMARWMQMLLGYRPNVISATSLQEIFTPEISARSKNRRYRKIARIEDTYYALGWRILHFPNDTLVYHGGYVNGYRSEVAIYQKDKIGICILSNAPGDVTDAGIPIFLKLYMSRRDSILKWEEDQKEKLNTLAKKQ